MFDVEPDNCVDVPNAGQENADNDAFGDVCEPNQTNCGVDSDGDGIGDAQGTASCDNCPGTVYVPGCLTTWNYVLIDVNQLSCFRTRYNPDQADGDGDGAGDKWYVNALRESTRHVSDAVILPVSVPCTRSDNCPDDDNSNQADGDGDGVGDVCDSALCSSVCLLGCDDPSQGAASCTGDGNARCAVDWSAIAGPRGCEGE
jgi:syndecan 4